MKTNQNSEEKKTVKITKKELKKITFAKQYYKLKSFYFTTIRGVSFGKKFKVGEDIQIIVKGGTSFKVKIIKIEYCKIADLQLSFLKRDADAPGEEITSLDDFLDILNSLRKDFMPVVTESTEMAIFYLFKVHKFTLAFMQRRGAELIELFKDSVLKMLIAGSIRREKDFIKDIELVAIPKINELKEQTGLDSFLGTYSVISTISLLQQQIEQLEKDNLLIIIKKGPKYIQFFFKQSFIVDLFLADETNFGLIYMIRTGSADYSHNFMTQLNKKGQFKVQRGYLTQNNQIIPTLDERSLYQIVGFPWKRPHDRLKEIF